MASTTSKTLPCGRRLSPVQPSSKSQDHSETSAKLDGFIEEKGLNRSISRDRILEVMLSFTTHFSTGEVVKKVQSKYPGIGAATVYRNFPIFIEAGVLRESFVDSSRQPFYEISPDDHHDHIVCLDCNAIFEFHEESIEKAQDRVSSKLKFAPASHKHVIYAHCDYRRKRHDEN